MAKIIGDEYFGLWCLTLLPAALTLLWVFYNAWMGRRASGWPSVSGRLKRASYSIASGERGNPGLWADLRVSYSYWASGVEYEGKKRRYCALGVSRKNARRYCRNHRPGDAVRVYYDPGSPSRAVLEPGVDWMFVFLGLVLAAIFGAVPAIALLLA